MKTVIQIRLITIIILGWYDDVVVVLVPFLFATFKYCNLPQLPILKYLTGLVEDGADVNLELGTEPLANPAVEEEVDAGVEDKEDVIHMGDAEEPGRNTVSSMSGVTIYYNVFQNNAIYCNILQCITIWYNILQYITIYMVFINDFGKVSGYYIDQKAACGLEMVSSWYVVSK